MALGDPIANLVTKSLDKIQITKIALKKKNPMGSKKLSPKRGPKNEPKQPQQFGLNFIP